MNLLMMDRVPEISRKMGLGQVEQEFSSFFAKFLPYLIIFQSFTVPSAHCSTLKNNQIRQKFGKKPETRVSSGTRSITTLYGHEF